MKKYSLLGLLLGLTAYCHAQTISIKDKETNEPLELVTLLVESTNTYVVTNAKGQANISEFKGAAQIQISSLGYQTLVKSYSELESVGFLLLLEPSNLNLNDVVVVGSGWKQSSNRVVSKIISISPKEMALQNPQTSADLLALSGMVFMQKSQQGGGSPMIRGFATNRLLYTVDGVRMNTAIFRAGNIQNVINIDPFAVENTEVLFGPGSVIYGSDAIGGVMSFQTLTPLFSVFGDPVITGKAIARYSSANQENTGHFDVKVSLKKWAFVTSISSWDYDHLRQGSFGPNDYLKPIHVQRQDSVDRVVTQDDPRLQIPTAYSQINIMQKVRFKPNEKWDFQYGFHLSETSPYGRYDRHNRFRNGTLRYAEWAYGPQKWMMNNVNITYTSAHKLFDRSTLRLAHQLFEESRIDRSLNSKERNTQAEKVAAYSANLDFTKKIGARHILFYGAEFVLNDVVSTGMLTDISNGMQSAGPSRYPQAKWRSLAVYLNDEFNVSEKVTVQAGLRYSNFQLDAQFDTAFYPFPFTETALNSGALTGSIGASYRPSKSLIFSTNFGTAFRSPNVDDMGKVFDSEPGTVTVPNPNLKAEYAYNFDLGVAKVFGNYLKLDLTGYYTILQNALVRRNFQLNGQDSIVYDGDMSQVQAVQNAAVANVYGIQAGLEVKLGGGLTFSSNLNYQMGEEELDDGTISPSRHAAPLFGTTRLSYHANRLNILLYTMYQGERSFEQLPQEEQAKVEIYAKDANGKNYSPAWYTLNLKMMYGLTENFSISSGIENITDQRYRPYSSGMSAPGKNFILSVKAQF